jgi:hypothetical protein
MDTELIVCFADGPNEGRVMRNVLGKSFIQYMRTLFGKQRYIKLEYTYTDCFRGDDGVQVMIARLTKKDLKIWKYHKRGIPTKKDAKYSDFIQFHK